MTLSVKRTAFFEVKLRATRSRVAQTADADKDAYEASPQRIEGLRDVAAQSRR